MTQTKSSDGVGAPATPSANVRAGSREGAAKPLSAVFDVLRHIDAGTREFEFTPADFDRVSALIYQHAGITLTPVKQDMVYSRLARRVRARGLKRFKEYLDIVERRDDRIEWEAFVNSLTTNLTSFFREAHHFELLAKQLKGVAERRTIKIWCCAASTGEEPYSLAITACEAFASSTPPVQILASDLDTNVLNQGRRGVYGPERLERLEAARVQRFFKPATAERDGAMQVKPELQRLIRFEKVNLLDPSWASVQGPFDAIFCRNVMIYFDRPTQRRILERFVPLLRADGLLYAGHSENFLHAGDILKSLGRTVYARARDDDPA